MVAQPFSQRDEYIGPIGAASDVVTVRVEKPKRPAEELAEMIRDGLAEEGFEVQVHSNPRTGWDVAIVSADDNEGTQSRQKPSQSCANATIVRRDFVATIVALSVSSAQKSDHLRRFEPFAGFGTWAERRQGRV